MKRIRTSESLMLLLNYLALIGIWFAIPSINLLLNRDERWPIALVLLGIIILFLFMAYIFQWNILFPPSASLKEKDKLNL